MGVWGLARFALVLGFVLSLAAPLRAATLTEVEGFFSLAVSSAASCPGPGECVGVDVSLAPGAAPSNTILFARGR